MPLIRELQRATMRMASTLSRTSAELRDGERSLSVAINAQRLLQHRLDALTFTSFHSFAVVRAEKEASLFRRLGTGQQLIMKLREGFENRRGMLEVFDFDRVIGPEVSDEDIFHQLLPHMSRILLWKSCCLIIHGGRNSGKLKFATGMVAEASRRKQKASESGLFPLVIRYMHDIYMDKLARLLESGKTEEEQVKLLVDFSEAHLSFSAVHPALMLWQVYQEQVVNFIPGKAAEPPNVLESLVTLSDMLRERGNKPTDDAKEQLQDHDDASNNNDEEQEEQEETFGQEIGEQVQSVLESLQEALDKSAGRLRLEQEELDRRASEKVARAKRLSKAGSRTAEGELVQHPHRILSMTLVRKSKVDGTREIGALRVVVLGNAAEREDVASETTSFVEQHDQSLVAIARFLERKHIKQSDPMASLGDSALSGFIRERLARDANLLLLTFISSNPSDFNVSVADCRFSSYKSRQRPSTAQRLERVKYRWQNQSVAWALALWKGSVEDSVQVQLTNQVENLTEELEALKKEKNDLQRKMEEVARRGVHYELEEGRGEEDQDALEVISHAHEPSGDS